MFCYCSRQAGVYNDVYFALNLLKVDKKQFDTPFWFNSTFSLESLSLWVRAEKMELHH